MDLELELQNLPIGILQLDCNGYILNMNDEATRLLGAGIDSFGGRHLGCIYNNDQIKADYELKLATKDGIHRSEGWRFAAYNRAIWCETILKPQYSKDELIGFTCMLYDLGDRKNKELELRKSEERYRLMVEKVKDYAIFMLDEKGHILTWNYGAMLTKGYTESEILGKHFSIFYTAEDLNDGKPARELKIAIETGKYEEEGWRVKKDGSVFWANILITALKNNRDQLLGFSKVTRDLTHRKNNEESLRQSEERYRSLVEQVVDYGIFMMDEKGRIISWNKGAMNLKGYTAEEIIGKHFSLFYTDEDIKNDKPANELKLAIKNGKYEEEGWRVKKDGSLFWANILITAVYNKKGSLIGFSKVTRDLTERKEAEKALQISNERYKKLAAELKITNQELIAANQELEQFSSIVSHDLQEPIRTIKSFLQLMELKLHAGEYENLQQYIAKSAAATNRMRELIQNLLQYAQLSKKDLHVQQCKVEDIFNEAIQNLKSAIDNVGAGITLKTETPYVYGDPVQLLQLLQNIISNALKFTGNNKPEIEVACTIETDGVKFAVTDNGIGIAAGDLKKIFEIFRRLHTEKEYPGTGIGLAICKKIVDRHGGRIWPESVDGNGTTFYFTLNNQPQSITLAHENIQHHNS